MFESITLGFIIEKLIIPLIGVIWWGLNRRIDNLKKSNSDMNADQYVKIHKQNDEIATLRAHMAEKFMMKEDYDRLERKKKK